jgi:hypothetical protein
MYLLLTLSLLSAIITIMNKNLITSLLLVYSTTVSFVSWFILSVMLNRQDFFVTFFASSFLVGILVICPLATVRLLRSR